MAEHLVDLLAQYRAGEIEWYVVNDYHQEILWLAEDALVAAKLLGILTPWEPDAPPASDKVVELDVFIKEGEVPKRGKWRWPRLQKALDWLRRQAVMTFDDAERLVRSVKGRVFVSGTLTDPNEIQTLKDAVADSIREGDDLATFRGRIQDKVATTARETETIFRTNTKRAYLEGQDEILHNPVVKRTIKYVLYRSTMDGMTRPWHKALDGWIAEVDSPLHDVFKRLQSQYNCRCVLVPVSELRLAGRAVYDITDVPPEVMQHVYD